MNPWIPAIAIVLAFGNAASAAEATEPLGPLAFVESSVTRVLGIAQSASGSDAKRTGMIRASRDLFDFDEIARRSMGPHWKVSSDTQQAEFVRLFTTVLQRAFLAGVAGYTRENVTFTGEAIDGGWAQVRSRITPHKGDAVVIEYRLHAAHGGWTVYDVVWEHVSLVASYRSQFNTIIRSSSVGQLLDRMRTDPLPRPESSVQAPSVPDRFAAGLLLAVLTRRGAQSWPSPAAHGSSPQTEVRR